MSDFYMFNNQYKDELIKIESQVSQILQSICLDQNDYQSLNFNLKKARLLQSSLLVLDKQIVSDKDCKNKIILLQWRFT